MLATIEQWDDELGVRIPKAVADQVHLAVGSQVTLTLDDGRLIVAAKTPPAFDLQQLLAKITPENRHDEIDFGPPVGNEVW